MQNIKTRHFQKKLLNNGFYFQRIKGSHFIYQNSKGDIISIPAVKNEINGCIARRLTKEFSLV